MVASISTVSSSSASTKYFADDGYYKEDSIEQEQSMGWIGKGAEELNLTGGGVDPEVFASIMDGQVPGDKLLGRTRSGVHEHRPGTDITFSASKSVSLAALINGDQRVITAHNEAVKATLSFVERDILESRIANKETKVVERVKGQKMVAACFKHEASRNLDPQLHTHVVIANMVKSEDNNWRTMENRSLYDNIKLIGAHYHNEMASNLKNIGYGIEKRGRNGEFEVTKADGTAIFSKDTLDTFSTRSAEIKEAMRNLGYDIGDPALKARAALLTRSRKDEPDRNALHQIWKDQAKAMGLEREIEPSIDGQQTPPDKTIPSRDLVEWGIRHLEERNSVFTRSELRTAALTREPGYTNVATIDTAIAELTAEGRLISAEIKRGDGFTTDKAVAAERENIARLEAGQGASKPIVQEATIDGHFEGTTLTKGQREAVHTILDSKDAIVGVQGYAGSGKTTMLNTMREIMERESDAKIIGLAPSASAAKTLEAESGIESNTLQSFLAKYSAISEDRAGGGFIEKMKEDVQGSIIVVDEASLTSTIQMRDLLKITDTLEPARVVLVGDVKQLDAVDAGKPFQQLQDAGMNTAVMDQIMRQRDDDLKAAVIEALSGKPSDALERLDKNILEAPRGELAYTAATKWLMLSHDEREQTGLMAPTHALREVINDTIRHELARDGVLTGVGVNITQLTSTRMTEAEREVAANYETGQTVLFERDVRGIGVEAGDMLTVDGIKDGVVFLTSVEGGKLALDPAGGVASNLDVYDAKDMELREGDVIRWTRNDKDKDLVNTHQAEVVSIEGNEVSFATEDGRMMEMPVDDPALQHIDYAFNSTVHAFQGRTVENVIAVLDSSHAELTNQKTFYVEVSRAKDNATLITDNREQLAATLELNTGEREAALEVIGEELSSGKAVEAQQSISIENARMEIEESFKEHLAIHDGAPDPIDIDDGRNYGDDERVFDDDAGDRGGAEPDEPEREKEKELSLYDDFDIEI